MNYITFKNSEVIKLKNIPNLSPEDFKATMKELVADKSRVSALFINPNKEKRIYAVLAHDEKGELYALSTKCTDKLEALTPEIPQAHWFEREMAEIHQVEIENHPWLKPIRFQAKHNETQQPTPGVVDYFAVKGEEIHEVGVGPIHAGVIEPGHFRFQCHGEKVLHLEIELGYQHRGIESTIPKTPANKLIKLMEVAAGDTTIGHTTAYALNMEALANKPANKASQHVRSIALELERMANHTGDLGALAGDVGYLPTSSYCGRIRGDILNTTGMICGNRFGRGLVRVGGVGYHIDEKLKKALLEKLALIEADVRSAIELIWETPSVLGRFEETGTVSLEDAIAVGLVGPAARACGVFTDVRRCYPFDAFLENKPSVPVGKKGDVNTRAMVRKHELYESFEVIRELLENAISEAPEYHNGPLELEPEAFVVSLTEGWRGEVCHVAITDEKGQIETYKMVDPSFHNWFGLALALRNEEIFDFPLCNKSFNLSYCGHDL
jgi:Ni,Fe-hydrogenase III large subunit